MIKKLFSIGLIIFFIILLIIGILRKETNSVQTNASIICTSCIGIE